MKSKVRELKMYYGTFGIGSSNGFNYQPILAATKAIAVQKMKDFYGYEWAFMYTEQEWLQSKEEGMFASLKPFPVLMNLKGAIRLVEETNSKGVKSND